MIHFKDVLLITSLILLFHLLFQTTILFCEAKKDENIRKFSSDLNSLIHNIRHKLVQLQSRIRDPDLLHEDTIAVSALENIRFLQDEVDMLAVNARSYSTYQDRFGSSLHQVRNRYMEWVKTIWFAPTRNIKCSIVYYCKKKFRKIVHSLYNLT